jgi:hypothetical protein
LYRYNTAMLLAIQSLMLISRSFISLRIARKVGGCAQVVNAVDPWLFS